MLLRENKLIPLLYGILVITTTIQLITTTEDGGAHLSTTEFELLNLGDVGNTTEFEGTTPMGMIEENSNSCNDNKITCLSKLRLELLEEAVIRLSITEIDEENFDFLWDYLRKVNPAEEQPLEKIIKQSLQKHFSQAFNTSTSQLNSCFENNFVKLLKFVSQSSNRNWKLTGYLTLFSEITSNTTTNQTLSFYLNLHHYIRQDESTNQDVHFRVLLSDIESLIEGFIQSPQDWFSNSDFHCGRPLIHFEYFINRICSDYSHKILQLWNVVWKENSLEVLGQFISGLEKNNRMNYTLLAIPLIKDKLYSEIDEPSQYNKICYLRSQLHTKLETLPRNGTLRKLLLEDKFYIKNAYDQQYLNIKTRDRHDRSDYRFITSSYRNFTWTFRVSQDPKIPKNIVRIINKAEDRKLAVAKCEVHNEFYVKAFYVDSSYEVEDSNWLTEIMENENLRIQSQKNEEYLRLGRKNVVTISEINEFETSKFEWILESDQLEDRFDKGYDCRSISFRRTWRFHT